MKQFENDILKMEVREGILISEHIAKEIIDLKQAKETFELRLKHIGDYPYPILADATKGKGATLEAQKYVLKADDELGTPAIAIIVDSLVSRIFGNLVINFVQNTKMNIRLFLDREKGIRWLKKYVQES
ncbi:MAG: hypothetical protein WD048_12530 [Chitinophagales bacterium]